MPNTRSRTYEGHAAPADAVRGLSQDPASPTFASSRRLTCLCAAQAATAVLPGLPQEVWEQIARHLTTKQWCQAVACKAMQQVQPRHLIVHPGSDVNKGLQSIAWASGKWGPATLLDLKLRLKTKVPHIKEALIAAFEQHNNPLSQLTALQLGLEKGSGHFFGLSECHEWLLSRMPNLRILSLEGKLAAELDSMTSLRHLVLNVRWHPTLPAFIDGAAPCLETLCLQRSGGFGPPWRAVLDFSWLKCLQRLAWCDMDGCKLELPDGCVLHASQTSDSPWKLYWLGDLVTSFVFRVEFKTYDSTKQSSMLQDMYRGRDMNIKDLTVKLVFARAAQSLKMGPGCFAQARNLSIIRVLAALDSFYLGDVLEVGIPKLLKLRSLVLVAPIVKLDFECALTSAETLADMKIVSAELQCSALHEGSLEGLPYLQDELAPYLKDGLGLESCGVGEAGGLALLCVYIRRQGERQRLPAELLHNRCLCCCCWECLKLDGKLPPAV